MIMKKYLVTLNRPVTIDGGKPELYTIYGLLVPYEEITKAEIDTYISYLAAMHEWSVKRETSFSVNEEYDWVDHNGVVHPCCDEWAKKLQKKCRKRLALDFSLSVIHVDETEDCTSIKGKFDLKDYLISKIPNGQADKFRCTYSNFEFDNTVNRIIKYTCKQLMNITSKKNQKAIRTILTRLNEVADVRCTPNDCKGIRLSKMHRHYDIIISMKSALI